MDRTRSLFRGPSLVLTACDEEFVRLVGGDLRGWPARLLWVDAESRATQDLMDATYRDGISRSRPLPNFEGVAGVLSIDRVDDDGEPWGVFTLWTPLPVPRSSGGHRRSSEAALSR